MSQSARSVRAFQVNGLFACDTMLLIMFAHHPGLMMVQFMVKGSDSSQILGFTGHQQTLRGRKFFDVERIYFWPEPPMSTDAGNLAPRPQETLHRQDHLLGEG
jgi:hypothetical protein